MKLLEPFLHWQEEIKTIRRDLHAHPELAFEEKRTSDQVAAILTELGIPIDRGLGGTGVVGILKGKADGPAIGLRADMDALPMQEVNQFAHASKYDGKMHGCGHDGHTAMLLNAARYLAQHRDFAGTVYLIFQPAEEGGNGGARRMIEDGLFKKFPMKAVFGMHNWPGMAVGEFGVTPGPIMASSNIFTITVNGKGAHAGMPQLGHDPIMATVQIAQALQTIVTRNRHPLDAAVLSITQIHAGSAMNVIPGESKIMGTVRTFTTETLDLIQQRMGEIVSSVSKAMGCEGELAFTRNYPPTVNSEHETEICVDVMRDIVGPDNVDPRVTPTMGAEDFSFMLQEVPGCYVWIGNGMGEHREHGHGLGPCMLHNGSYDFNDELLPLGATYWVKLVDRWFERAQG
ncbi:M20 aminoacylase family protein [Orrella daihaiensis]|uniref:Amidohydrolase n=1 Tax=Orrella daihaiensis TaxID=2782176 RepID=A0ABY4AK76_9BURK|nr:M20 aminoacylase family protein [Orrella daihaiensis]UOD49525.1 amidohydrolase [Orrella daihaiensis]